MLTASEPDVTPEIPPPMVAPHPATPPSTAGVRNPSGRPRLRLGTAACFGLSVMVFAITIALDNLGVPAPIVNVVGIVGMVLFGYSTLMALFRAVHGVVALVRSARGQTAVEIGDTLAAILGNLVMAGFGTLVAYFATVGFSRGRQLRRFGRVLLPGLRSDRAWATSTVVLERDGDAPAGVADQWRENGKTEHASVAAFARLTLDLMALGAPPALITGANQDALDEIRHTELCFSLARALDGQFVSPGPFPQAQRVATLPRSRTLALAKLAVDSLVDGALHEGVSARIIAKLAQRCEVAAIRAALKEIAADEGRHAAHGWAVVGWCLDEGGAPVGEALRGAIRALPKQMRSSLPEPAADGGWERWGIHGHRLESEEYAAALAHVVARVRARVASLSRKVA